MESEADRLPAKGVWGKKYRYSRLLSALGTHVPDAVRYFKGVVECQTLLWTLASDWILLP